jgi:hypothetical protein
LYYERVSRFAGVVIGYLILEHLSDVGDIGPLDALVYRCISWCETGLMAAVESFVGVCAGHLGCVRLNL